MSYDRAELEQVIRTGGPLPQELLDIFKQNAARRRSAKRDARMQKVAQHLRELTKAGKPSPLTPSQQRFRRGGAGFPRSNPVPAIQPPPPPLACNPGWTTIGDKSAPFSWGSQETPSLGTAPDGTPLWSVMTRRETGEFSLALVADSDPTSPYIPTTDEVLGFKGVTISATISQTYFVGRNPVVLQGQARLAMNSFLWDAARVRAGDAYAETVGTATLTVSQFALELTGTRAHFPSFQTELLGESSTETDLFLWGSEPDGKVFTNAAYFTPGPLDLSATLAYNSDAILASIDVDVLLFGAVIPGAPHNSDSALIYLDYRVDDPSLIVGPESDGYYYDPLPYPSPILLKEVRLCSYP